MKTSTVIGKRSDIGLITAILSSPQFHYIADNIPTRPAHSVGRPDTYGNIIYLLYACLGGEVGSHSRTVNTLANQYIWNHVRKCLKEYAGINLPSKPPTRAQLEYGKKKIATNGDNISESFSLTSLPLAQELGCLLPAPFATTDLTRGNNITGDGKVIKSPILPATIKRNEEQGNLIASPANWHREGGEDGNMVFGTKYAIISTRPDNQPNNRIVLDVRHVPHEGCGGEAGIATRAITEIMDLLPGIVHSVTYDGALRGVHINQLTTRGAIVLSPLHGNSTGVKAYKLHSCSCGKKHQLFTKNGSICEQIFTHTGDVIYQELSDKKILRRKNPGGTYRWYITGQLSCGKSILERIDTSDEDSARKFNRAERIRQSLPTETKNNSLYDKYYGWREDSESYNRLIESNFNNRQVIGYSIEKQTLALIGMAVARNAIAYSMYAHQNLRNTA